MGNTAVNVLQYTLDASSLSQKVVANNIANNQTPGFQATQVHFEQALQAALNSGQPATAQAQLTPETLASRLDGNNVSLTNEMVTMQKVALDQQFATTALTATFHRESTAIQG